MTYFYIVFLIVGILLETTFSPLPIALVGVILFGASTVKFDRLGSGKLLVVVLSGLFLDLFLLRPLGVTAFYYTLTFVLVRLYSRKFETIRLGYLLPFTGVVTGIYSQLFYLSWKLQIGVALLVVFIVRWIIGIINRGVGEVIG